MRRPAVVRPFRCPLPELVAGDGFDVRPSTFDLRQNGRAKGDRLAALGGEERTGKQHLAIGNWTDPPRPVSLLLLETGN